MLWLKFQSPIFFISIAIHFSVVFPGKIVSNSVSIILVCSRIVRTSQTIDMSRLTRIIPRLRHSYYIRDRDLDVGGFNRLCRFISRQCPLTWNIRQSPYRRHVRARYFLLTRAGLRATRESTLPRRLRFSSLTLRCTRIFRTPARDESRSRSSLSEEAV